MLVPLDRGLETMWKQQVAWMSVSETRWHERWEFNFDAIPQVNHELVDSASRGTSVPNAQEHRLDRDHWSSLAEVAQTRKRR